MYIATLEVAVHPGVDFVVETGASPWVFGEGDPEGERRLLLAQEQSIQACRAKADLAREDAGVYQGPDGAQVLSVRLNDVCQHSEESWVRKACGHTWCERCAGYVNPKNRVALTSAGPIITCNRVPKPRTGYKYWFREHNAGTANLTSIMKKAFGTKRDDEKKVAEPEDKAFSPDDDLSKRAVVQEKKKRTKERDCMHEHFSPPCSTFVYLAAQYLLRSSEFPEGDPEKVKRATPSQLAKLAEHTAVAKNVCALARIKHEIGDFFSVEQPDTSIMFNMKC